MGARPLGLFSVYSDESLGAWRVRRQDICPLAGVASHTGVVFEYPGLQWTISRRGRSPGDAAKACGSKRVSAPPESCGVRHPHTARRISYRYQDLGACGKNQAHTAPKIPFEIETSQKCARATPAGMSGLGKAKAAVGR